jgi:hypothetical protein
MDNSEFGLVGVVLGEVHSATDGTGEHIGTEQVNQVLLCLLGRELLLFGLQSGVESFAKNILVKIRQPRIYYPCDIMRTKQMPRYLILNDLH